MGISVWLTKTHNGAFHKTSVKNIQNTHLPICACWGSVGVEGKWSRLCSDHHAWGEYAEGIALCIVLSVTKWCESPL